MTFKIEFRDGTCVEWERTDDGSARFEIRDAVVVDSVLPDIMAEEADG